MSPGSEGGSHSSPSAVLTNVFNPFVVFTVFYTIVAFEYSAGASALLYLGLELLAAAAVAAYVVALRRRSRVEDFWISRRADRYVPAIFLLSVFVVLLTALKLFGAPDPLYDATLSMAIAAAAVAAITFFWKASAHTTVAGHAAVAGPLLLGAAGLIFVISLPLVLWARVTAGAHTVLQACAGAGVGASIALLFLT